MIRVIASGIDTLHLSIKVALNSETLDLYRTLKSDMKEQEQRIDLGLFNFRLQKHGARMYEFLLKSDQLDLKLTESKHLPNILIEIRSSFIQQVGYKKVVEHIEKQILKSKILDNPSYYSINVSRVDLFCDVQGFDFNMDMVSDILTKAKKKQLFQDGDIFTGFLIGKFPFAFRAYDKTIEIRASQKQWITEVWNKSNKYNPGERVVRFEFELGRQTLSKVSIDTIGDLFKSLKTLWNYCLDKFSLREKGIAKQRTRKKESSSWQQLRTQAAFKGIKTIKISNKIKRFNENRNISTATNALVSLFSSWEYDNPYDGLTHYYNIIDGWLIDNKGLNFKQLLDKKRSS